jgi:hypothetical protein
MARRAASALAAMLAVVALALPAVLLTGQPAAAAATGQQSDQALASIAITSMTPQWASPGSTIRVTGTLRNTSGQQSSRLTVQLLGSATPVASVAQLQQNTSQLSSPATTVLPGRTWQASGQLAPGATAIWSIRLPASALRMTAFGVYPLAAQAQSAVGTALATTTTYLPFEAAKKGRSARSRPSPVKIAWLWPLADKPLLNEPWQSSCAGPLAPLAGALARSLGSGGRLGELVRAGVLTQTTESWAAAGSSRAASAHAAEPPQSLADVDGITWVVDPALLANVRALTTCRGSQPQWARAAAAWLTELRTVTAGRPLTVTPYGDPNVTALIAASHGTDVQRSFQLGRMLAGQILHRSMSPGATDGTPASLTQAAGIARPAGGVPGYGTLENLANVDGVRTVVLSSSAFPAGQGTVLRTLDGGGSYMTALLASQSLTELLGSASRGPGAAFATAQEFLAETALLAQQIPQQPIVVAPPQRWDPPAGLAAALLADTAFAPWLSPVSLTSLPTTSTMTTVPTPLWPSGSVGQVPVSRSELRKLRALNREITQLQSIRAKPDRDLYLAVSTVESSAWQGKSTAAAKAMLATVSYRIAREQQDVQIIAEKRITLGGLKGSVPVSIDNRLGYAVKVRLQIQYSQASGISITPNSQGLILVPARAAQTVRLRVEAAKVGSTTITMRLASPGGQLLAARPERMTIQATQVGVLGMIIFAAALGVFLIASAARAVRRGRPGTNPDQPVLREPAGDHDGAGSAGHAGPDTVMAERTELGAAGKPGP